jgi:ACS family tartrate transporter-like MFS transporter
MEISTEAATLRKLGKRFTLFLGILYFFSWVNRSSVGIAALQMNKDLGLTATMFGLGTGLFYAGYAIFEVPSNILLHKVGARLWIARIMITWGIFSTGFGFIHGPYGYYALRFLLGVAEAGFFPGIVYYLTLWFPSAHRARPYALFLSFSMIGVMVMSPMSSALMKYCDGLWGMAGWRWMFIIEGVPAVLLGIVTLFYLTDYPRKAKWLTAEQKQWLEATLEAERKAAPPVEHHTLGAFLADGRLWALGGFYLFWNMGNLGVLFWLPTILKSSTGLGNVQISLLYSVPFLCAVLGINAMRWVADRTGRRKLILVGCSMAGCLFLIASAYAGSLVWSLLLMCVACFNIWGVVPVFWTLPADYLGGVTAAAGIAFVSSWSGVGGFAGPYLVGLIKDATGKFQPAVVAMAVAILLQGCIVMAMKIDRTSPRRAKP